MSIVVIFNNVNDYPVRGQSFLCTRLVEMSSWRWLDCRQHRLGATHFLTKGLEYVKTEMSLHVLAYNFKRLITVFR
jgi:hypothetical protein